jgi:hypothetical protein
MGHSIYSKAATSLDNLNKTLKNAGKVIEHMGHKICSITATILDSLNKILKDSEPSHLNIQEILFVQ